MSPIIPLPHASGVYQITCIPTGKIYIGSSQNILLRSWRHRTALNAGKHESVYLQRAWSKYGRDAFVFAVLELCPVEQLLEREQYFLDHFRPYDREIGFNHSLYAGAPTRGRKHSAETRKKIGEANRNQSAESRQKSADARRGSKRSPETRKKISEASKRQSAESRERIAQANRGRKASEETLEKRSESLRAHWAKPENRKKLSNRPVTDIARQRMSESARRAWAERKSTK